MISVVTRGEILVLARVFGWGAEKVAKAQELLRELVVVDIGSQPVMDRYAEIGNFIRKGGHAVGDNDVWIAATAAAAGAWLLTSDKDFDPLAPAYVQREWIDPTSLK